MNYKIIIGVLVAAGVLGLYCKNNYFSFCQAPATPQKALSSFYQLKAEDIDGKTISMANYKGKYVLIVNTASKCGYTGQYKQLEELYQKYQDKLVVLAFPTNDFLWQEPGSNETIKNFCSTKYQITFPLFAKITVKGKNKSPIYQWLTDPAQNGWCKTKPSWNFNKYLIGPDGNLLAHFDQKVNPLSEKITQLLK